jgi:hypothetical protein
VTVSAQAYFIHRIYICKEGLVKMPVGVLTPRSFGSEILDNSSICEMPCLLNNFKTKCSVGHRVMLGAWYFTCGSAGYLTDQLFSQSVYWVKSF